MDNFSNIVSNIKDLISCDFFIALTMFVAIYFSIRMIFPQFRLFPQSIKSLLDNPTDKDKGISPFSAFMTALGSRIGVGNVAGVATAIAVGGPGAICWIWIFGLFGSAVAIVEAMLAQAYKIKDGDEYLGGPAYYIKRGFKNKKIAHTVSLIFAICSIVGLGILMPGVQSNTVVDSIVQGFNFDKNIVIVVTSIIIIIVIWGGIKRIAKFESVLTPIKFFLYLSFAIIVIVYYSNNLSIIFNAIITSAFGFHSLFGGIVGSAINMGVRRGLFSTDVGYGPGGTYGAAARCSHPVNQGLLQGLSVLFSTLIVCTATALIILCSGCCQITDPATRNIIFPGIEFNGNIQAGAGWVQAGLDSCPVLHGWSPQILGAMVAIFATGAIVGYYYVIENNLRFIMGKTNKFVINIVKFVYIITLILSTIAGAAFIWDLADIGLGILGWINFISLLVLSPKAIAIIKDYSSELRAGIKPKFIPEKYDIDDKTDAWKLS